MLHNIYLPQTVTYLIIIIIIIIIITTTTTTANVMENGNFKLYWNRSIVTDKTVPFNGSDITFVNNRTKNSCLIDIAVPNTHNLTKTITDKQNKYQELANEICAMRKQKATQVIPIVISSTAVIPKSNKT